MTFLTDPTLALGLTGLADWSTELPVLDLMKMSRPMWAMTSGNGWGQDHVALVSSGVLDADGWPTALPPGATGIRTGWGFGDGIPGTKPSWFGNGGGDRYKPKATKQLEAGELAEFNVNGGLMIGSTGHNVARADAPLSSFVLSRDDNGDLLLTSASGVMRLKDFSGCIPFAAT